MRKKLILLALSAFCIASNAQIQNIKDKTVRKNFEFADTQLRKMVNETEASISSDNSTDMKKKKIEPVSLTADGNLVLNTIYDWRSGFFPGMLWYMYEMTKDAYWKEKAEKFTAYLNEIKSYTDNHDVGFMMYCSYGNGLRIANEAGYKDVLIETARSLITRFNPKTGCIRSWNPNKKWQYPVIIDNMMNLELLFWASSASGNNEFRDIAIKHANTTMANHFRSDYSTFHVVDYDARGTGKAVQFHTHQGYADWSAWARGQSWGLYGYTMSYRWTKDKKYLEQAEHIADFLLSNENLPKDMVPYWDYDAPEIPNVPRDVSAGAIMASALYELSTMSSTNGKRYKDAADKIVETITNKFRAAAGEKHGFLTISSTGHLPGNSEIDVPLIYADYYFLEALIRKERLAEGKPVVP